MRNLLISNNVRLTTVTGDDISSIEEWFNNVEFLRNYDFAAAVPKSHKKVVEIIEGFETSEVRYMFAIRLKENNEIIGLAGFDDIIWSSNVATFFIGIGNNSYTGKGIGKDVMELLLDFGFNELGFHRIQLNVIGYNKIAIKLYEKVGFIKEGTYREFVHRDGKRHDMHLYGLLEEEWRRGLFTRKGEEDAENAEREEK